MTVEVGQHVEINGKRYEVVALEECSRESRAITGAAEYRDQLRRRPLDRFLPDRLVVEPFEPGVLIAESWVCARLKNSKEIWNVYEKYEVRRKRRT